MANTAKTREGLAERHPGFTAHIEPTIGAFQKHGKDQEKLAAQRDIVAASSLTTSAVILGIFQDHDAGDLEAQHSFANDLRESVFPSATYERINNNMGTLLGNVRRFAVGDGIVWTESRPRAENKNYRYYTPDESRKDAMSDWTARVSAATKLNQLAPPKVDKTRTGRSSDENAGRVDLPDVPVKDWPEAIAKASGAVVLAITNACKVAKVADESRDEILHDWSQLMLHSIKTNATK